MFNRKSYLVDVSSSLYLALRYKRYHARICTQDPWIRKLSKLHLLIRLHKNYKSVIELHRCYVP